MQWAYLPPVTTASGILMPYGAKPAETGEVAPLYMSNFALGGGSWLYTQGASAGQIGVDGACGLNNVGLLVSTAGKVSQNDSSSFFVDDGSRRPVLVVVPSGVSLPNDGTHEVVTGVSSLTTIDGKLVRTVDVRYVGDINP